MKFNSTITVKPKNDVKNTLFKTDSYCEIEKCLNKHPINFNPISDFVVGETVLTCHGRIGKICAILEYQNSIVAIILQMGCYNELSELMININDIKKYIPKITMIEKYKKLVNKLSTANINKILNNELNIGTFYDFKVYSETSFSFKYNYSEEYSKLELIFNVYTYELQYVEKDSHPTAVDIHIIETIYDKFIRLINLRMVDDE